MIRRKDIEIMAPVGSYESLNAAINAGADSVYFGVEQLNMRAASSVNFTLDDLAEIVRTAHAAGVKTYLMVQAMSRASEAEREVLRTTHKNEALSDAEKISTIKALYEKLDVKHATEQQIELRFERALSVLNTLSIAGERTVRLEEFARNLMGRKK